MESSSTVNLDNHKPHLHAAPAERSRSRGREVVSTGRGGAGNMTASPHRGEDIEPGQERGREIRDKSVDRITHSGRGGAGNIRSPSRQRDQAAPIPEDDELLQEKLIAERRGREENLPVSTGRGGAGNMGNSRSRSRSRLGRGGDAESGPKQGASGRGGWGNIQEPHREEDLQRIAAEQRYEQEVLAKYRAGELHGSRHGGRGGAGNVEKTAEPLSADEFAKLSIEEKDAHLKMHTGHGVSTGKGGFGNIQEDGGRGRDRDQHKGGVLGSVFRSLSRAAGGGREPSREPRKETA